MNTIHTISIDLASLQYQATANRIYSTPPGFPPTSNPPTETITIPMFGQPALVSSTDGPKEAYLIPMAVPTPQSDASLHVNNNGWNSFAINKTDTDGDIEIVPISKTVIAQSNVDNDDLMSLDEPITC